MPSTQMRGEQFKDGSMTVDDLDPALLDTDGTLAANSDVKIPTQAAVRTYGDANYEFISGSALVSSVASLGGGGLLVTVTVPAGKVTPRRRTISGLCFLTGSASNVIALFSMDCDGSVKFFHNETIAPWAVGDRAVRGFGYLHTFSTSSFSGSLIFNLGYKNLHSGAQDIMGHAWIYSFI